MQPVKEVLPSQASSNFYTKQVPSLQLGEKEGCTDQTSSTSSASTIEPKLRTCPYLTTYIPNLQSTKDQYNQIAVHFETRVKYLWKKIWFGLYQVEHEDEDGLTHATKIRKLYAGAGMGHLLRQPYHQDANVKFRGYWEFVGLGKLSEVLVESGPTDCWPVIGRLKMYDGMALDNMQHISLLLNEYEKQVYKLAELYHFLELQQIPQFNCEKPTDGHVKVVLRGFQERAGRIVMVLSKLDLQMGALQRSINKEASMLHGRLDGPEMLDFKKEVLKP